jgi:hypothetical protein
LMVTTASSRPLEKTTKPLQPAASNASRASARNETVENRITHLRPARSRERLCFEVASLREMPQRVRLLLV